MLAFVHSELSSNEIQNTVPLQEATKRQSKISPLYDKVRFLISYKEDNRNKNVSVRGNDGGDTYLMPKHHLTKELSY
jgi:hypothetical protein